MPTYRLHLVGWFTLFSGLVVWGIVAGGPSRWFYFTASLVCALRRPFDGFGRMQAVMVDWANAISLQKYAGNFLDGYEGRPETAVQFIRAALAREFKDALVSNVSTRLVETTNERSILITLSGELDKRFLAILATSVANALDHYQGRIDFACERLSPASLAILRNLTTGFPPRVHLRAKAA